MHHGTNDLYLILTFKSKHILLNSHKSKYNYFISTTQRKSQEITPT